MRIVSWSRGFVLCFCIQKLIGFVSVIHSEDLVTLCLFSLRMAQCNITLYIVVFNLDKKNCERAEILLFKLKRKLRLSDLSLSKIPLTRKMPPCGMEVRLKTVPGVSTTKTISFAI